MLLLLAQTDSAPATAPALPPWDIQLWTPTSADLLHASLTFAVTLLIAIFLFGLLRRPIQRTRLAIPYFIAFAALALYLAAWGLKPGHHGVPARIHDPLDPISYWLMRTLSAAVLYAFLRFLDRTLIVTLLTRGGKVPIPRFFHQMVNIVLALFAILIFGSVAFGWDIDRFLAGSAVVSIVLGLALQESLGNFFSGLVMQASPPFAIGDWIICGTHEGRVVDMTWRAVTLHTNDDNFIHIPNATVAKAEVINYHAPTTATARSVTVGLESDVPPAQAAEILRAAALETPGVQTKPEPYIFLDKFGDAVDYIVKFWITEPKDHLKIEQDVRVHIWYRLREKGLILPNPVRTVEHVSISAKHRAQQAAARGHRLAAVDSVPLLQPLSAPQKLELADSASEVFLTTGQILFRQNDAGDSFYIIYKGQVEVLVTPEGSKEDRVVATLGPGNFFGEMSALTGQPRSATIRALTPLSCVEIEKRDLLAIFQADPGIMEKISEIVAKRNIERDAVLQGAGSTPAPDMVLKTQKSLLGRMMNFFGLGKAA